jgi:hypothetical protein
MQGVHACTITVPLSTLTSAEKCVPDRRLFLTCPIPAKSAAHLETSRGLSCVAAVLAREKREKRFVRPPDWFGREMQEDVKP